MNASLRFLLALSLLVPAACAAPEANDLQDAPSVVVFLVRHAERAEDGTNDPPISAEGQARAALLAEMLEDAGIQWVHSTDLQRTRQTGAPLVEAQGLTIESYDPRDLPGFAARLRGMPGRHLVLGHSNTTPELVAALGGTATPIADMEYDRLYMVVIPPAGAVTTALVKFGAPFVPAGEAEATAAH